MKLSDAQRHVLESARDHDNPTLHLRGRAGWGGYTGTFRSLFKRGLLTRSGRITEAGLTALTTGVLPKP